MTGLKLKKIGRVKFLFNLVLIQTLPFWVSCKATSTLQQDSLRLIYSLDIGCVYTATDNLQNLYVATSEGSVIKFDNKGNRQFEYNNKRLGQVGKIEARNPFNILVYYPELAVIIILDRTLSEIKELNLFDLDIIEPQAIAIANDNNIWLFDQVSALLKKIDQEGNVLFESRNLNQILGKNLNPSFLKEYNNLLYLSDPLESIFIFDLFGQLKQILPIEEVQQFQIWKNQVIYLKKKQLMTLDLETLEESTFAIPQLTTTSLMTAQIQQGRLILIEQERVRVFQF